jgi:hypothetical protein
MARDFWLQGFDSPPVTAFEFSSGVFPTPRESTGVVETLWRRRRHHNGRSRASRPVSVPVGDQGVWPAMLCLTVRHSPAKNDHPRHLGRVPFPRHVRESRRGSIDQTTWGHRCLPGERELHVGKERPRASADDKRVAQPLVGCARPVRPPRTPSNSPAARLLEQYVAETLVAALAVVCILVGFVACVVTYESI